MMAQDEWIEHASQQARRRLRAHVPSVVAALNDSVTPEADPRSSRNTQRPRSGVASPQA